MVLGTRDGFEFEADYIGDVRVMMARCIECRDWQTFDTPDAESDVVVDWVNAHECPAPCWNCEQATREGARFCRRCLDDYWPDCMDIIRDNIERAVTPCRSCIGKYGYIARSYARRDCAECYGRGEREMTEDEERQTAAAVASVFDRWGD